MNCWLRRKPLISFRSERQFRQRTGRSAKEPRPTTTASRRKKKKKKKSKISHWPFGFDPRSTSPLLLLSFPLLPTSTTVLLLTPSPWIASHVAFFGHPPSLAPGVQIRAHWVGDAPAVAKTHSGVAVVPAGTSVGHGVVIEQVGEQKAPVRP